MSTPTPQPVTPPPVSMTQMWMALILALVPLTAGAWGVIASPLMALVLAEIEQYKATMQQTGELTAEEVAAFDAWLLDLKTSPAWQVRL
jgi:outer membrane lipoprotein-sorting protein